MFEFVRTHTKVLQVILLFLIVPAFVVGFGLQGYSRLTDASADTVAKVAGQAITRGEWDAAHREQVERIRSQMPGLDARFFESPAMKQQTLERLVRERVLLRAADQWHLVPSDQTLMQVFKTDPRYEGLRGPDGYVRQEILAAQGLTSARFAGLLRHEIALQQVAGPIAESALAPAAAASAALGAYFEQREVQLARFDPKDYTAKVSVTDADIKAHYEDPAHAALYTSPESAQVEYVVLDLEAVKRTLSPGEDELKTFYEQNRKRYQVPEERRARHILIKAAGDASADEKAKARAKAEAVLAQVQKNRAAFAEIAKKESQDEGSAPAGGDLDYFARGGMSSEAFENAAFALKKGELSGVVESEHGFHIIEVTDARGGEQRSFESVRAEVEDEVRNQLAQSRFAEVSESFNNAVYQKDDTLAPAAEQFKLTVQKARITRTPAPGAQGVAANPKFLEAMFKPDSLGKKRNIEPVETGPNELVSGRVLEYNPAHRLPLEAVSDQIKATLVARKAAEAARADGQAKLAQWRATPDQATLPAAVLVSREQLQNLPRLVVDAVLREPPTQLPAWVGVDLGSQGYVVARLLRVVPADPALVNPGKTGTQGNRYAQALAAAEEHAYHAALRQRYKVQVTGRPLASDAEAADEEPVR